MLALVTPVIAGTSILFSNVTCEPACLSRPHWAPCCIGSSEIAEQEKAWDRHGTLPELAVWRGDSCAQDILLLGGHNGAEWLDSMHLYTPGAGTIIDAGRMRVARGYGGAAMVGRSVYVAGGGDGSSWLRSAERYDLGTRRWEAVRAWLAPFLGGFQGLFQKPPRFPDVQAVHSHTPAWLDTHARGCSSHCCTSTPFAVDSALLLQVSMPQASVICAGCC